MYAFVSPIAIDNEFIHRNKITVLFHITLILHSCEQQRTILFYHCLTIQDRWQSRKKGGGQRNEGTREKQRSRKKRERTEEQEGRESGETKGETQKERQRDGRRGEKPKNKEQQEYTAPKVSPKETPQKVTR